MRLVLRCLFLLLSYIANSVKAFDNHTACGAPGKPFEGTVDLGGETIHYSCKGFNYLLGNVNRTCRPDGKWTGSVPVCQKPAKFEWAIDSYDESTKQKHVEIDNQGKHFFDYFTENCSKPIKHGGLNICITLKNERILEGVRVVFPMQSDKLVSVNADNHNFSVYSDYNKSRTQCIQSDSGKCINGNKYQVTFDCSSRNGTTQRLSLVFEKTNDPLSICEIYLYFRTDDLKCHTPDAPFHGIVNQMTKFKTFNFYCDDGFTLNGSISNTCARNGSWSQETPMCIKNSKASFRLSENGENHRMLLVIGGILGITVIVGIVFGLYCAYRRRSEEGRNKNRTNHSYRRSYSLDRSFSRERLPSVRYSANPCLNHDYSVPEERPRIDIPDILEYENGCSLNTLRDIVTSPSPSSRVSDHIYAEAVYDELKDDIPKK